MVFTFVDELHKCGWFCLRCMRKHLSLVFCGSWGKYYLKLHLPKIFGIELLFCSRIVSCDFLLLDTKWNLSATCPLPVLKAGNSEQLTFRQAVHFVRGSEQRSRKFISSCERSTVFGLFFSLKYWCLHRVGCSWAFFSALWRTHFYRD